MSPELTYLLAQVPLVGVFGYFVIIILQRQSAAAKDNHAEWRQWLIEERQARQDFTEQQNTLVVASIERMNERITMLEMRRAEERAEMLVALRDIHKGTEHLSQAIEKMIDNPVPKKAQ